MEGHPLDQEGGGGDEEAAATRRLLRQALLDAVPGVSEAEVDEAIVVRACLEGDGRERGFMHRVRCGSRSPNVSRLTAPRIPSIHPPTPKSGLLRHHAHRGGRGGRRQQRRWQ